MRFTRKITKKKEDNLLKQVFYWNYVRNLFLLAGNFSPKLIIYIKLFMNIIFHKKVKL